MSIRGVQPLRDHGEQRHAFPARSIRWRPPVDAGLAILHAGVPSHSTAEQNGLSGVPVFLPELWIQPWKRLLQDYGRGDGKDRALAQRYMAPAAGTAYLPGPDSRIGIVLSIIRCRNARLRVYPVDTCSYCHACRRSSYRCTGACISRHRTSNSAAINPPHVNSGLRCSGAGARGGCVHAWTLARRDARSEVLAPQHGSDVPCCIGAQVATRDVFDETFKEHRLPKLELTSRLPPPVIYRLRPPLPRRRHGSTLRYGVVPGSGSSAQPTAGPHVRSS